MYGMPVEGDLAEQLNTVANPNPIGFSQEAGVDDPSTGAYRGILARNHVEKDPEEGHGTTAESFPHLPPVGRGDARGS